MIRKIRKTCDCFLAVCLTTSIKNINRYILGQKCVFHSRIKPVLCDWIVKKQKMKLEFVVSIVLIIWFVLKRMVV